MKYAPLGIAKIMPAALMARTCAALSGLIQHDAPAVSLAVMAAGRVAGVPVKPVAG